MPIYRCDFVLFGDLVLPPETPSLVLNSSDVSTTISNGDRNEEGHVVNLRAVVVGDAHSLDQARHTLGSCLAAQLDLLSFTTHSRFKIATPVRAIEWNLGLRERKFRAFHKSDTRFPPEPEFKEEYLKTVSLLDTNALKPFTRRALKYFRYGLLDEQPEDQFLRLWLSLEIIAENAKDKEKVPLTCPVCNASMKCQLCGAEPTRTPMAKQAIISLISGIAGGRSDEICKRQFSARNGLMHGGSTESIEKECKASMAVIVNELGSITWHAIMSTIPVAQEAELCFGHRDGEFVNSSVIAAMLGQFMHADDHSQPSDDKIPNVEIALLTRFGGAQ